MAPFDLVRVADLGDAWIERPFELQGALAEITSFQLDAHCDTGDDYLGSRFHHGAPFRRAVETGEFYFVASSVRKSVWTFVRQLRGPHFRTWAWCKRRSRSAVTAAVSLRSLPQSSTGRFDVRSVDARS